MESLQQRQPLRRSQRVTRHSGDVADRSLQRVEGRRDGLPVDDVVRTHEPKLSAATDKNVGAEAGETTVAQVISSS